MVGGVEAFGALLGPERTRAVRFCPDDVVVVALSFPPLWFGLYRMLCVWLVPMVVRVLGWLFENCTVDASIFVVKLLRAHGGCLGIRSR